MAKWSAVTLLREVLDFQQTHGVQDEATLAEIKVFLKEAIVEEQIEKSMKRVAPKAGGKKSGGNG